MTLINYILSIAPPPPLGTQIPVQILSSLIAEGRILSLRIPSGRAGFQVLGEYLVMGNNSFKGTFDSPLPA